MNTSSRVCARSDGVVLNGTNHKWLNNGDEPCVMGSVMLGADRRTASPG